MSNFENFENEPAALGYLFPEQQRYPIRYAVPGDLPALQHMREESAAWIDTLPETGGQWHAYHISKENWSNGMLDCIDARQTLIADDDSGQPLVTLTRSSKGSPILFTEWERQQPAVYVSHFMRRRAPNGEPDVHKGVGKRLLDFAADEAHDSDAWYLRLDTWYTNERLPERVYLNYGFEAMPSRRWGEYPAGRLFQLDLGAAAEAKLTNRSPALKTHQIVMGEADPFEKLVDLTPAGFAKWKEQLAVPTGRRDYKDYNMPPQFAANAIDGWITYPEPMGAHASRFLLGISARKARLLREASGIPTSDTFASNIYETISLRLRPDLVACLGLAKFLAYEVVYRPKNSARPELMMALYAIEKPIGNSDTFDRAAAEYGTYSQAMGGLLVRGTFADGGLLLGDKRLPLRFGEQAEHDDEIVVDHSYQPPTASELNLPSYKPKDGDTLMARLSMPPGKAGEKSFWHATLLRTTKLERRWQF